MIVAAYLYFNILVYHLIKIWRATYSLTLFVYLVSIIIGKKSYRNIWRSKWTKWNTTLITTSWNPIFQSHLCKVLLKFICKIAIFFDVCQLFLHVKCIFLYLINVFTIHWNVSFRRFLSWFEKSLSMFSKTTFFYLYRFT